jgi:hypothetical protein
MRASAIRVAVLVTTVAACARGASTVSDVPVAFGRWQPPQGQSCYVDELEPRELPALSMLLDSAAVVTALRAHAPGDVLMTLAFDASGRTERAEVIDRRMARAAADGVREIVTSHLHAPPSRDSWGVRLRAATGDSAFLALGRRELCPPVLARIEPLALANTTLTERDLELIPSPDWILRGAGPPAPAARSGVEKAIAGIPAARDTSGLTIDSVSTAPDITALGDDALTLRVLIDTTGTIAHAEIARAAAGGLDRERLVAELARYRFHPALEDRLRTPSWVILKIK